MLNKKVRDNLRGLFLNILSMQVGGKKNGLSLIELLVAITVVGVIGSVGLVQYGDRINNVDKRMLHNSAKDFIRSVQTCVSANRGWKIMDHSNDCTRAYPCCPKDPANKTNCGESTDEDPCSSST